MLSYSLIFSSLVLLVANLNYQSRQPGRAASGLLALVSLLLAFSCMIAFSFAVLLTITVVVALKLFSEKRGYSARKFLGWSIVATVLVYLGVSVPALLALQRIADFRIRYPLESISHRLAYESRREAISQPEFDIYEVSDLASKVADHETSDSRMNFYSRNQSLRRLHASSVRYFVMSPGFGVSRMPSRTAPTEELLRVRDHPDLPIELPPPEYDDPSQPARSFREPPTGMPVALKGMHRGSVFDFLNPQGFGYIKDRDHVAGFVSHGFSKMPQVETTSRWVIQDLALVSLLKHDAPAAYLSKHLPRMKDLRDAPTRPLVEWEKALLEDLQNGDELKVLYSDGRIRMLGSIRAANHCLQCHEVQYGQLLGAFSYKLKLE